LIILIKEEYLLKISENLDLNRLVLAPYPGDFPKRRIRDKPHIVGFVGSRYDPNIFAMSAFIRDVWPSVQDLGMELYIYGAVGEGIDPAKDNTVVIRGFVENGNDIYDEIDIVVNPVLHGAGFKIKTIEALGNGLPLISTQHSVMGLPEGKEDYFLIADKAVEFQKHLRRLHGSFDERTRLGNEAYRIACNHFSPNACFAQLLQRLNWA
jgi:glycosyltransferase involved in cell wall biosynthesis